MPANSCASDFLRAQVKITRFHIPERLVISRIGSDSLRRNGVGDTYQWYVEGQKVAANTPAIHLSQQGLYTLQVIKNGCPSPLSAPFHYVITGLETPAAASWSIYPNHSLGTFTVTLPLGVGLVREISVLHPLGRIVRIHRMSRPDSLKNWIFPPFPPEPISLKLKPQKAFLSSEW